MHSLLKRQLKKHFGPDASIPENWLDFINAVDEAYEQADKDRLMVERSLELTSEELTQRNQQLSKDLEARNTIEQALEASEKRVRLILETSPLPVIIYDKEGKAEYINRAFEKIFGWEREELLGSIIDFVPEEELEKSREALEKANAGQTFIDFESCRRSKTGERIDVEVSIATIMNEAGMSTGNVVILRDITERKHQEEIIRANQERLRQVIDTNPNFVFAKDREGRYTLANQAMAAALNTTVEELIGKTDEPFTDDKSRISMYLAQDKHVIETGEEFINPEEFSIRRDNGEPRWTQTVKRPLYDQHGNVTEVLGVVNEITAIKLAEERLRKRNNVLEVVTALSRDISLAVPLEEVMSRTAQVIAQTEDITSIYICDWNPATGRSVVLAEHITKSAAGFEMEPSVGNIYNLVERFPHTAEWLRNPHGPVVRQVDDPNLPEVEREYLIQNNCKTTLQIPIVLEEQVLGYIEIYESRKHREFEQESIDFLQTLSYQLAIAINDTRLFEAQRQSEERFRALVENTTDIITTVTPEGVILYANPTVENILGYTPEELIGTNLIDLTHEEESDQVIKSIQDAAMDPDNTRIRQFRFCTKDGKYRHLESLGNVVKDETGNVRIYITAHDITDQIENAAEQLRTYDRRGEYVRFSTEIAKQVAMAKELPQLYNLVVNSLHQVLGFHHAMLFRYNPAANGLIMVAASGDAGKQLMQRGYHVQLHQNLVGKAAGQSTVYMVQDTEQDAFWSPTPFVEHTRSELATPILLGDELLGVIDVQSNEPNDLDADAQLLMEVLTGLVGVAIQSLRLRDEMEERLRELNALQRITTTEGWQSFRESAPLRNRGYAYDPDSGDALPLGEGSMVEGNAEQKSMTIRGEVIGMLSIEDDPNRPLTLEEQELLDEVTSEVAEALERARLFEASQRSAAELSILNEMGNAFSEALDESNIIENIYIYANQLIEIDQFFVARYISESDMIDFPLVIFEGERVSEGHPQKPNFQPRPGNTGLTGYIIQNRQSVLIEKNAEQVLERLGLPFIQAGAMTQSWVGVPLVVGDRVLGVLSAQSDNTPGLYNQHHQGLLTAIASQAAIAIDNARRFQEEQERAEQERLVRTITDHVRRGSDAQSILRIALEELGAAMGTQRAAIQLGLSDQLDQTQVHKNGKSNGNEEEL